MLWVFQSSRFKQLKSQSLSVFHISLDTEPKDGLGFEGDSNSDGIAMGKCVGKTAHCCDTAVKFHCSGSAKINLQKIARAVVYSSLYVN